MLSVVIDRGNTEAPKGFLGRLKEVFTGNDCNGYWQIIKHGKYSVREKCSTCEKVRSRLTFY